MSETLASNRLKPSATRRRRSEKTGDVPPLARVEWEHIQRVLADCRCNISQAARVLGVHRRSLQFPAIRLLTDS
jgi:ActR/RegA family two-component response regulator